MGRGGGVREAGGNAGVVVGEREREGGAQGEEMRRGGGEGVLVRGCVYDYLRTRTMTAVWNIAY